MARLRWRLRTAMLLPILAAVAFTLADGIRRERARIFRGSREYFGHALSLGLPAAKILAERDRLLAIAGPAIRADLLALAERYPILKKADDGTFLEELARTDQPGTLQLYVVRSVGLGGKEFGVIRPGEAFRFETRFYEHSIFEPPPISQVGDGPCFPHLGLWGGREATAEDLWLARELRQILDRRLAPLDALEARLAALPIPPTGVPGGMPAAR